MFSKILIANRGEIACRIVRTARPMGVATVAVYSEADAGALHVALADEARLVGPPPAAESYLNIAAIIGAARESGAEAIHPGYGFLSENAAFAEACAAAGIVFIGPPAEAIRHMGDKAAAKALVAAHGVPVVPGYDGAEQNARTLRNEAERLGFPVLIKAAAGGGGRGMRIVGSAGEFARALDGARREAKAAFGDDRVLLERYLERPRHIEVQIFGDQHGNLVHLWERDCSIQRRYQKIVEEAPAPGLGDAERKALGKWALAAAKAVGYVGAGTVEFVVAKGAFYFIEMNTRLQVEHPVTEAVTGIDLVEWQLRIAAGEGLPLRQKEIAVRGHAIEARLYAENPARGFLPATGTLHALHFPGGEEGARIDTGVRAGDVVGAFYDPLIAKLIARGDDRDAARRQLSGALADTALLGVASNRDFLARIVGDAEFAAGGVDTGFIERRSAMLLPAPAPVPEIVLAAASLFRAGGSEAAVDPWSRSDGWRLNLAPAAREFHWRCDGADYSWQPDPGRAAAERLPDGRIAVTLDGLRHVLRVLAHGATLAVFADGDSWQLEAIDPLTPPAGADVSAGRLSAPMPGRIVELLVAAGDEVRRGQPLIVVEAMKMEHTIAAPRDGRIALVNYAPGDLVEEGAELIALAPEAGE